MSERAIPAIGCQQYPDVSDRSDTTKSSHDPNQELETTSENVESRAPVRTILSAPPQCLHSSTVRALPADEIAETSTASVQDLTAVALRAFKRENAAPTSQFKHTVAAEIQLATEALFIGAPDWDSASNARFFTRQYSRTIIPQIRALSQSDGETALEGTAAAFTLLVNSMALLKTPIKRTSRYTVLFSSLTFRRDVGELILELAKGLWVARNKLDPTSLKHLVYDRFEDAMQHEPDKNRNRVYGADNVLGRAWNFIEDCLAIREVECTRQLLRDTIKQRLPDELFENILEYVTESWKYIISVDALFLSRYGPWPTKKEGDCPMACNRTGQTSVELTCPHDLVWIWNRSSRYDRAYEGQRSFSHAHYIMGRRYNWSRCRFADDLCSGHFTDETQWRLDDRYLD